MKLSTQRQPTTGILLWASENCMALYYPNLQGDGEHVVHWETEYDDSGNTTGSWQPFDLGSPESAIKILPVLEESGRIALARDMVRNA